MALAETTISAAVGVSDTEIKVASATSVAAGRLIRVDGELMQVRKSYVSASTTVPVFRGVDGSLAQAHPVSARIVHGDPADFAAAAGGSQVVPLVRNRRIISISAAGTCPLPAPGEDLMVILNGTSVIALTIPVPTKEMDGARLLIAAQGAGAHTLTFTGGLGDAGTGYDVITLNGTKKAAVEAVAVDETWVVPIAPAMGGTVTNIIGTIA